MNKDKGIIYLIDGTSYIHRAYHAIRNLANSKGFPTNAVLGFTKMVLKLLSDKNPGYMAVVFDSRGPTFRHDIYKDYKANRPPMPEDMAMQIPVIKSILKKMNLEMMELKGYEADDIIGTLARMSEEKGFKSVMVTGDKDFRQLLTPSTCMWDSMKDKVFEYEALKEEHGFEPQLFIDVMGLSGDSVDNIPGVPGVGEKTAIGLIREYGSFEAVFENLEKIKKKRLKENLRDFRDQAVLSRKLVEIDRFVPLDKDVEDLKVGEPEGEGLADIFREMEFRGLWDQFASRSKAESDYSLCLSLDELKDHVRYIRRKGVLSIDTETTSTEPLKARLVGISFSCESRKACYVPFGHSYLGAPEQVSWEDAREVLKDVLEDEKILKVGQNIKYDAEVLRLHGVELKGIHFDTMLASYVINPGMRQHNLDSLAQQYLNHKMIGYHDVVGKGKNERSFSDVEVEKAMAYSCEDADIALLLVDVLERRLRSDKNEALFYELEMKLIPVLMDMELEGISINAPFFRQMSAGFTRQMKELEAEIYEEAGMEFNLNSPQQLGEVLFKKLQLPGQKKTLKTGRYSTDVKVLKKLTVYPHKVPGLVLRYRTLTKLKSTYLDSLVRMVNPATGRVHTSYNQTVTATGRLSSSNPNMQNIPIRGEEGREIRKGFVPKEGHFLVSADYSQVELRIFAHYSGDAAFIEAFKADEDIHARTASEIMGDRSGEITDDMRRIAKAINFGIIYGMGPRKLGDELGIELKVAKNYISAYLARYKGVARYKEEIVNQARENGYVETLFGRRRYLPDITHGNRVIRAEAERIAVNTPIQGTAADLIKMAMVNIHNRIKSEKMGSRMLLQVHDELVFEVPENELDSFMPLIKYEMENVYQLKVPLKVDINKGGNWDEAH